MYFIFFVISCSGTGRDLSFDVNRKEIERNNLYGNQDYDIINRECFWRPTRRVLWRGGGGAARRDAEAGVDGGGRHVRHDVLLEQTAGHRPVTHYLQGLMCVCVCLCACVCVCVRVCVCVCIPQQDDEVGVTWQLLHPLSTFCLQVVDLLPEKTRHSTSGYVFDLLRWIKMLYTAFIYMYICRYIYIYKKINIYIKYI